MLTPFQRIDRATAHGQQLTVTIDKQGDPRDGSIIDIKLPNGDFITLHRNGQFTVMQWPTDQQAARFVDCFINGAAHAYYAKHNAPLVDEDLAMAMDAARAYTASYYEQGDQFAHRKGADYIASFNTTPDGK